MAASSNSSSSTSELLNFKKLPKITIPKYDGQVKNYLTFKTRLKAWMQKWTTIDILKCTLSEIRERSTLADIDKTIGQAIIEVVDDNVLQELIVEWQDSQIEYNSGFVALQLLEKRYLGLRTVSIKNTQDQLRAFRFKQPPNALTIAEEISAHKQLIQKLKQLGRTCNEVDHIQYVLDALPNDDDDWNALLRDQLIRPSEDPNSLYQLIDGYARKQRPKPKQFESNNLESNNNSITCFYCKRKGHKIKDCRKRQYNERKRLQYKNNQVNHLSKVSPNLWLVDTGASVSTTYDKSLFETFTPSQQTLRTTVTTFDCPGFGSVRLDFIDENGERCELLLSTVYYSPNSDKNILGTSSFDFGLIISKNDNYLLVEEHRIPLKVNNNLLFVEAVSREINTIKLWKDRLQLTDDRAVKDLENTV